MNRDERGLLMCRPPRLGEHGVQYMYGALQPYEARRYLLYWDKLSIADYVAYSDVSPTNIQSLSSDLSAPENQTILNLNRDSEFLESCGRLSFETIFVDERMEPQYRYAYAHNAVAERLIESDEIWSVEQLPHVISDSAMCERVLQYRINNILPVPRDQTPLNEIMEFRAKHKEQLLDLRNRLDQILPIAITASNRQQSAKIELAKLAHEIDLLGKSLKQFNISFSIDSIRAYVSKKSLEILVATAFGPPFAEYLEVNASATVVNLGSIALTVAMSELAIPDGRPQRGDLAYIELAHEQFKLD